MPRLVFMGTPEFAVPVLSALADNYQVVAVYTRADKPAGRGKRTEESPVKQLARERGLTIEQPRTLRDAEAQARLRGYQPDVIVVAAYGLILPPAVLEIPARGCINVHASLLPRWRGASPIPFVILASDAETGVTLMKMDAGLDTGPIIAWQAIPISPDDTTGTLTAKLSHVGAEILIKTLPAWLNGSISPVPQDDAHATVTRLVKKEDGLIDWSKSALEIARAVRAYNPWPSAYTFWRGVTLKVLKAESRGEQKEFNELAGTVSRLNGDVGVTTGDGVLILREVQLAGKRAMTIEEFVRGQREFVGARLGKMKS
jgi:methionyl-tRNA formyltransferase